MLKELAIWDHDFKAKQHSNVLTKSKYFILEI